MVLRTWRSRETALCGCVDVWHEAMQGSVGITSGRWDQPSGGCSGDAASVVGAGMLLTLLSSSAPSPWLCFTENVLFPPETTLVPDVNMH